MHFLDKKSQTKYQNVFSQLGKVCPIIILVIQTLFLRKWGRFRSQRPDFWPKSGQKPPIMLFLLLFAHFGAKNRGTCDLKCPLFDKNNVWMTKIMMGHTLLNWETHSDTLFDQI